MNDQKKIEHTPHKTNNQNFRKNNYTENTINLNLEK